MDNDISILMALQISGICMTIVFVTLVVISLMIDVQKVLLSLELTKGKTEVKIEDNGKSQQIGNTIGKKPEELETDEEIAVAFTAAIEASEGTDLSKVRIVAIREIS